MVSHISSDSVIWQAFGKKAGLCWVWWIFASFCLPTFNSYDYLCGQGVWPSHIPVNFLFNFNLHTYNSMNITVSFHLPDGVIVFCKKPVIYSALKLLVSPTSPLSHCLVANLHFCSLTCSKNLKNLVQPSGSVIKSAVGFSVGRYFKLVPPLRKASCLKWKRTSMSFVSWLIEWFKAKSTALWWSTKNCRKHAWVCHCARVFHEAAGQNNLFHTDKWEKVLRFGRW